MAQRGRGVAYRLWRRVEEARVERQWTKVELADAAGLPRSTIDRLQYSTRAPQPRIVHALADAIGLGRREAEQMAGVVPGEDAIGDEDVREAITNSPYYDDKQKETLLNLVDMFNSANRRQAG
jgi:transcriptional regulator with XRE-family HTH domain